MSMWNDVLVELPNPHLLQTQEWGEFKSHYGWTPIYQTWKDSKGKVEGAALLLKRELTFAGLGGRWCVLYVPKGPLLDWGNAVLRERVLSDLEAEARRQGAIFIKIDADVELGRGAIEKGEAERSETDPQTESEEVTENSLGLRIVQELGERGWRFSEEQIQFRNTVLIDLTASEEEMLARMKQKTRYNVRLASRKGVTVRRGGTTDIALLYRMYAETSMRDGFVIREEAYYQRLWDSFIRAGMATPLIAEVDGEAVAAIVLFHFAKRAWYIHGMSRNVHREKMPNHLVQWEAMRTAKALGCEEYDLWGAPNEFSPQDPMWGVYQFKRGLGGMVVRTMGAYDLPIRHRLYWLYTRLLPRVLAVMRRRGKEQTAQALNQ